MRIVVDKHDVIVVGAGLAGSAAAYYLAKRGYDVLLVEKAKVPGQRNVTGGILYGSFIPGYGLIDLIPDFESEAPLERRVVKYRLAMISSPTYPAEYRYRAVAPNKRSYMVLEIDETSMLDRFIHRGISTGHDYTVIRAKFDRWFARKVEEVGGIVVTATAVEDLVIEDEKVVGIRTNKEEIHADLVIDASGITSKLVIKAGLRKPLDPSQVYHGIKQVYQLSEDEINKRFGLKNGEGMAIAIMGDFLRGMIGGGFIYTNRDTISVGLVVTMSSMLKSLRKNVKEIGKPLDVLEDMISHPYVSRFIEGAKLVEYSAHNIPKGPMTILEKPLRSGFLVAGDALGAFVKIGGLIDGMRRAIATGIMAAQTYIYARKNNDFSEKTLSIYLDLLQPIYRDIRRAARNSILSESKLLYGPGYKLLLRFLGKKVLGTVEERINNKDALQKIQERTGLLVYEEDKNYSHIKIDYAAANRDPYKLWVPACPTNCYTLSVPGKGIFASYRDLYRHNLDKLKKTGSSGKDLEKKALEETWRDVARAEIRFDHVACVSCGTCWVIGPPDVISFNPERSGHGVKFRYG
ncbi:MAG: hypothetical protein DJ555_03120 [Desulfurococcaceae archaeon]|nr:MAG: hypothetical protein DJ555_03120 [Desulfurococcaceae archaeon]